MEQKSPKLYQGILIFLINFLYLWVVAPLIGLYSPLVSLVSIQLVLVAVAVCAVLLFKLDFSAAFPFKLPPIKHFFAAVFLYAGIYMFTICASMILMLLFPDMMNTVENIAGLGNLMPNPIVAVIIMAFLPAVCEELLVRGFILSSFSKYKPFIAVICAGVMFGILHFDVFRFVPTAILGMASAYVTLKTKSLLLPMLYHFVNNVMSVSAIYQMNEKVDVSLEMFDTPEILISILVVLGFALILSSVGILLFREKRSK